MSLECSTSQAKVGRCVLPCIFSYFSPFFETNPNPRIQVCHWADEAKAGLWTLVWSPEDFDQGYWQHTVTRPKKRSNSVGFLEFFSERCWEVLIFESMACGMPNILSWKQQTNPIASMYGIFTYIYHKHRPNVGINIYHTWMVWELVSFSDIHWHSNWPRDPNQRNFDFNRYLCCMNPTAGSFIVNQRLQRHFWTCAVPFPEQCLDFEGRWTKRSLREFYVFRGSLWKKNYRIVSVAN